MRRRVAAQARAQAVSPNVPTHCGPHFVVSVCAQKMQKEAAKENEKMSRLQKIVSQGWFRTGVGMLARHRVGSDGFVGDAGVGWDGIGLLASCGSVYRARCRAI